MCSSVSGAIGECYQCRNSSSFPEISTQESVTEVVKGNFSSLKSSGSGVKWEKGSSGRSVFGMVYILKALGSFRVLRVFHTNVRLFVLWVVYDS